MGKATTPTVDNKGFGAFLGKKITLYCGIYIYCGTLLSADQKCLMLDNAQIVYNTGPHDTPDWEDAKEMPHKVWYVRTAAIESFGYFK